MAIKFMAPLHDVLNHIEDSLDGDLSLDALAAIACYSPFYLHRLFKAATAETVNEYVTRKRLEKAALLLMRPTGTVITELAFTCGFSSNSSFTRAFKKKYGVSPSAFRSQQRGLHARPGFENDKNGQAGTAFEGYVCNISHLQNWLSMNANVEIRELERLDIAYVNHIGSEGVDRAFQQLVDWAAPRGLLSDGTAKMVRVYHDSFKVTAPEKVRMSAGIVLQLPALVGGKIGLTAIDKGIFIVGHFEIVPADFEKAWTSLFVWMNENGFTKADRHPFEIIHNDYNSHPEKKCIVDLCIPVE